MPDSATLAMNADAAQQAEDLGRRFLAEREWQRAILYLRKSWTLVPSQERARLLQAARDGAQADPLYCHHCLRFRTNCICNVGQSDHPSAGAAGGHGTPLHHTTAGGAAPTEDGPLQQLHDFLGGRVQFIQRKVQQWLLGTGWIHRDYAESLSYVALIIFLLAAGKVLWRGLLAMPHPASGNGFAAAPNHAGAATGEVGGAGGVSSAHSTPPRPAGTPSSSSSFSLGWLPGLLSAGFGFFPFMPITFYWGGGGGGGAGFGFGAGAGGGGMESLIFLLPFLASLLLGNRARRR